MGLVNRLWVSTLSLAAVVALGSLPGCAGSSDDEATGTLTANLIGQAPSGAVYRLRDAIIVVEGPGSTQVFNTEDDPNRTSLSANVAVGDYTSSLQPGFRVERLDGASTTPVEAELISPNPALFSVALQQRTIVPLQFRVFGEIVDVAQGYDIVLDIEECTRQETVCADGLDNDCDGAFDCDDSDCTGNPACAACGNGIVEPGETCDDGNTIDLDGCSSACAIEGSEIEPNEDGTPSPGALFEGNDFASASADANGAFSTTTTTLAAVNPSGDEDVFAFDNTGATPTTVHFDLWDPSVGIGGDCFLLDPVLVIRDAAGTILALNDDTHGLCPSLDFTLAPGQRAYAHVLAFGDVAQFNYAMVATYLP